MLKRAIQLQWLYHLVAVQILPGTYPLYDSTENWLKRFKFWVNWQRNVSDVSKGNDRASINARHRERLEGFSRAEDLDYAEGGSLGKKSKCSSQRGPQSHSRVQTTADSIASTLSRAVREGLQQHDATNKASDENEFLYPRGVCFPAAVAATFLGEGGDRVIYCLRVWFFSFVSDFKFVWDYLVSTAAVKSKMQLKMKGILRSFLICPQIS